MSYLAKLQRASKKVGLLHNVVETAEYVGASYVFGYAQNRWREQASIKGVPADLAAGITLKAASLVLDLIGKGHNVSSHINVVGNAGLGAFFHTMGSGHGGEKGGVKRLLVSSADAERVKKLGVTVLGDLGKAAPGAYLSARDLHAMAQ